MARSPRLAARHRHRRQSPLGSAAASAAILRRSQRARDGDRRAAIVAGVAELPTATSGVAGKA